MPLTSLNTPKKSNLSTILSYAATIAITGLIVYFGKDLFQNLMALRGKSVLTVTSANVEAEVIMNGNSLGKTPIESKDVKSGENIITIKTADQQYETTLNFTPRTHVVLNRDLGVSENFSSGQNFWIEKSASGTVLSVTSEPSGATIFIDNTQVGKTPYSSNTLTPGEYDLRIGYPGFEEQTTRIKIQSGYNLNASFKLFPVPVPANVAAFEGSPNIFDLSVANTLVTTDTQNWAKAASYWNATRGINIAGLGVNKEKVFDYFIDYKGGLYDTSGTPVTNPESLTDVEKGAYLGRSSDGAGLSQQAKDLVAQLGSAIGGKLAVVKQTGTGWLRVRDNAGLNGVEVARVDVGKEYEVLEEQTEWVKIKVSESIQGWVSKTYVDIK